uniref:Uncharacterized protein n=1 Tax=Rhizophora mucronata TaxID=61149 RepID=A0A2P2PXM7_RHIMU
MVIFPRENALCMTVNGFVQILNISFIQLLIQPLSRSLLN